jgi:rSAM/selenodomain-associated transferase 1
MNDKLVMVFIRNPELGKVKTRLAKILGDRSALKIYKFLLEHTEKTLRILNCDKTVFYSENINLNDLWSPNYFDKQLQKGDDLGRRMKNAFQFAFDANYNKVVIVGSDLPELKSEHIEMAFQKLDQYDIVIGPAQDGGYYLLGMNTMHHDLFKNKAWGTASVFKDTIKDLQNDSVFLLDSLNDIDTYDDLLGNNILKELIEKHD